MIKTLFDIDSKYKFKNSMIFSQLLKDAIVDNFRDKYGERPSVDTVNPDISFLLRIQKKEKGELFNAHILIEAILIKGKIAPTYLRVRPYVEKKQITFDCLKHPWFINDKKAERLFIQYINEVYSQSIDALQNFETGQFLGFDISEQSLTITRSNLRAAKIPEQIVMLNKRDATKIHGIEDPPGIVICNPPYGERMGEEENLKTLYHEYGENLKQNFKGYRAYIFTSKPDLRKSISLQTKARIPLFNGNLECRLIKYELY